MEKEKKSKLHTPKEILNALHVIQDTCEYHLDGADEDCKACPLCTMMGEAPRLVHLETLTLVIGKLMMIQILYGEHSRSRR